MKYFLAVCIIVILASCQNKPANTKEAQADTAMQVNTLVKATQTPKIDSVTEEYPAETDLPYHILTTGNFHSDEASPELQALDWTGLFKSKYGRCYTTPVSLSIKQVKDEIVDEGNEKTGWEVSTDNTDSCFVLIAGYTLPTRTVERLRTNGVEILPGQVYSYKYYDVPITINAVGQKVGKSDGPYPFINYQVFCKAVVNGKSYHELLVAHAQPHYGSNILFVGDIDGDKFPDILINTSGHENKESTTLYLTKPAENGHLFKVAGTHIIVGC